MRCAWGWTALFDYRSRDFGYSLYLSITFNLQVNTTSLSTLSAFSEPNLRVNPRFPLPLPPVCTLSTNYIIHLKLLLDPFFPFHFQGQILRLNLGIFGDINCHRGLAPWEWLPDFCHVKLIQKWIHFCFVPFKKKYLLNLPIFTKHLYFA